MTTGVIVSFDERNGFGFIRSRAYGEDVFVHARAVAGGKTLRAGQRVRFEAEPSDRGPRALRVVPRRFGLRVVAQILPESGIGLLLTGLVASLTSLGVLLAHWSWPLAWLAAVNPVTFAAFAWDKRRAILGGRRMAELTLLGLALAGGSPAALLSMALLRHKTQKGPFRLALSAIVLLHIVLVLVWWRWFR